MFSVEIKKTLSRPGIYVLIVMLAIVLVCTSFLYSPTTRDRDNVVTSGDVAELKNDYYNTIKSQYDDKLAQCQSLYSFYSVPNDSKDHLIKLLTDLDNEINEIDTYYKNNVPIGTSKNEKIVRASQKISDYVQDKVSSSDSKYYIITSESDYKDCLSTVLNIVSTFSVTCTNNAQYYNLYNKYTKAKYSEKLRNYFNNFIYPAVSNDVLVELFDNENNDFKSKYEITIERLNSLNASISAENDAKKLADLINRYCKTVEVFENISYLTINKSIFAGKSNKQINKMVDFDDYSIYETDNDLTLYTYLFEHNKVITDYNLPYSMTVTSGFEVNAYDFMFYALEIFAILVVVYALMTSANSISSEVNSGTIKFLALRPISRGQIYNGKMHSNIFMSTLLLVFGAVLSYVVGYIMFGVNNTPILAVINGSTAISLHPLLVMLIYVICMIIKIAVLVSIGMLLSTLLKSNALAITLSLTLFFATLVMNILSSLAKYLIYVPFYNINLFPYLMGKSSCGQMYSVFSSGLINGVNLIYVGIAVVSIFCISTIIGMFNLKHKEL